MIMVHKHLSSVSPSLPPPLSHTHWHALSFTLSLTLTLTLTPPLTHTLVQMITTAPKELGSVGNSFLSDGLLKALTHAVIGKVSFVICYQPFEILLPCLSGSTVRKKILLQRDMKDWYFWSGNCRCLRKLSYSLSQVVNIYIFITGLWVVNHFGHGNPIDLV
jgi:hypothetical protein